MADDIVVGSVAVDIVPDTKNFRRDLNTKLQGITVDVGVNADTTGVRAQLDEATQSRTVAVNINADTASAEAQIDNTARTRTARINTRVSGGKSLVEAAEGLGALTSAAVTLGPALIPISGAIVAIGAALAAPVAVAAGGLTIFGFITGAVIKKTEDQKKKIDQLAKAVDSAKQSLANTQASAATSAKNSLAIAEASASASLKSAHQALANAKTAAQRRAAQARIDAADTALSQRRAAIQRSQSASVAAAQRKVNDAVDAYHSALKELTPAQKRFLDAQDKLKGAFQDLIETSGPMILGPVTQALNTLTNILPDISPLIGSVSGALSKLLDDLGKSVKGPGFKAFIDTFSKQVGPDIVKFGHIAGDAIKGVTGFVFALGDAFGPGVLKGLGSLADKFGDLGQQAGHSQKLQDFVDYFHRVGPQVGDTIGAVARAVGHVVKALAPLGPPALKAIEGISNAISGIPVPTLTAMAAAFGALVLASKASKGLSALGLLSGGGGLGKGGGVLGQFVSAAKPVPVFVTNPGFGTPGGGGPKAVPINPKTGLPFAEGATAEAEAIRAAKAAAEAVKLAGGSVAAQSSAAGRAFKEAMAAHDAAVFKTALDFGVKGGVRGLLGTIFAAPAAISLNPDTGQAAEPNFDVNNVGDLHDFLKATGQLEPHLKATTSHFDALKASAEDASRTIDQIGPHADNSFGQASRDVADFSKKLDAIHDKKVRVLLDDLAAVQSLKALQALRLRDKTLTIHVEQEFDRVVGPGGGIGHPLGKSSGGGASRGNDVRVGPSSRSGDSGAGAPVQIDKAFFTDTNDVLRKADRRQRRRAGGAVVFPPARVTDFAGSR